MEITIKMTNSVEDAEFLRRLANVIDGRMEAPVYAPPTATSELDEAIKQAAEENNNKLKKRRRSKEEIAAEDDAACIEEIKSAFRARREPDKKNLPTGTRRRVGDNPKSWVAPDVYNDIREAFEVAIKKANDSDDLQEENPAEVAAVTSPVETPALSADDVARLRFEVTNKLQKLALMDRAAVAQYAAEIKTTYKTNDINGIPAEELSKVLGQLEDLLDGDK